MESLDPCNLQRHYPESLADQELHSQIRPIGIQDYLTYNQSTHQ